MDIESVLSRLEGVRPSGDRWLAKCPAHDDKRPSLCIARGEGGRILLKCHRTCKLEEITAALGITVADLQGNGGSALPPSALKPPPFPDEAAARRAFERRGARVAGRWEYTDRAGRLAFVTLRLDLPEGGKEFRPLRPVGGGLEVGLPREPRPLYNLAEVLGAPRVYVVEGEKCADALRRVGLVGTTSVGGAKGPERSDWSPLAGREIIILPDRDEPGREYAQKVREILGTYKGTSIAIVELAEPAGEGVDVADLVEDREQDGKEPEAIRAELEHYVEPALDEALGVPPILYFGDPAHEPEVTIPDPWVGDLLFPGYVVAFGQWKRSSKTRFLMALSYHIARGEPFLGRPVRKGRVLWVQRDTPIPTFIDFSRKLREGLGFPPTAIPFLAEPCDLRKEEHQARLVAAVRKTQAELVILDASRGISTVKENDSDEVAAVARGFLIDRLRDELGCSVVLLTHPAKGGASVRGSGDWEAAADSVLRFEPVLEGDRVQYVRLHGEGRHPPVEFAFAIDDLVEHGGGWRVREVTAEEQVEERDRHRNERAEEQILRFLRQHPGRHSQVGIQKGTGLRREDVPAALVNLNGRGLLEHEEGPRGAKLWGLREVENGSEV